jgi:hypothetical protein
MSLAQQHHKVKGACSGGWQKAKKEVTLQIPDSLSLFEFIHRAISHQTISKFSFNGEVHIKEAITLRAILKSRCGPG